MEAPAFEPVAHVHFKCAMLALDAVRQPSKAFVNDADERFDIDIEDTDG